MFETECLISVFFEVTVYLTLWVLSKLNFTMYTQTILYCCSPAQSWWVTGTERENQVCHFSNKPTIFHLFYKVNCFLLLHVSCFLFMTSISSLSHSNHVVLIWTSTISGHWALWRAEYIGPFACWEHFHSPYWLWVRPKVSIIPAVTVTLFPLTSVGPWPSGGFAENVAQ